MWEQMLLDVAVKGTAVLAVAGIAAGGGFYQDERRRRGSDYASELLAIAWGFQGKERGLGISMASPLEGRMVAILDGGRARRRGAGAAARAMAVGLLLFVAPLAMLRGQAREIRKVAANGPAEVKPAAMPTADYSTPLNAALTYWRAQQAADWKALMDGAEMPQEMVATLKIKHAAIVAERDLDAAVVEKFGHQKKWISHTFERAATWDRYLAAYVAGARVDEAGDTATVSVEMSEEKVDPYHGFFKVPHEALVFKKFGDRWKQVILLPDGYRNMDWWHLELKELYGKIASEIRAGEIKTFEAAAEAVEKATKERREAWNKLIGC